MSAAQAIRRAAIDDDYDLLSNEERAVLAAYTDRPVVPVSWTHYRTWMLFVAEELSPSLPVEAPPAVPACNWRMDDDESGIWATGCGNLHSFIDGGPTDNHQAFCGYCGGKLIDGGAG